MQHNRTELAALLLLLFATVGCNPAASHVQGSVSMDGQPADEGHVTFRAIDNDKPAFTIHYNIASGKYNSQLLNHPLPFGNYEVRVAVTKHTGRRVPLPISPTNETQDEILVVSAAEFNGPESPLRYESKDAADIGTFDIEVPAK